MAHKIINSSQRKAAIVAGISIVVMTIAAVVATNISIGSLRVEDNAAETMKNILASPMLFRIGVFSWLIILVCDVLAAWGLYIYFEPANKNLSLITAWFRLIYIAILGAAILNLIHILLYITGADYLSGFGAGQMETHVLFSLNTFYAVWFFGLMVFGIHILLLGYLIIKTGYAPKILGVLLMLAFFGYTVTTLSNLLFPQYKSIIKIVEMVFLIPMLGEVAFGIWLLYKGFKFRPKQ